MGMISAARLPSYLLEGEEVRVAYALPFRDHWRFLSADGIRALAAACAIVGTGSLSKLKYCALTVTPEAAEAILADHAARNVVNIRGQLAKSEASVTCVRQVTVAKRVDRIGAFITFRQVRTRAFLPAERESLLSTGTAFRPRKDPGCGQRRISDQGPKTDTISR